MRVVLATFGTAGDVAPFLEVGSVLRRRGHSVEIVTDVAHRALADAHQVPARTPIRLYDPVRLTTEPRYAQPLLGPYRLWRDVFLPLVPQLYHAVREALETPAQVVLVHPWCFGALYAAQVVGVPVTSMAMAAVTWWSAEDPGLYSHHRLPAFLRRLLTRGPVRWGLGRLFGGGLARARAALGLPPSHRPFFALGREAEAAYGLWSPMLRGAAGDDPRGATIAGFLRGAGSAEPLEEGLRAFLAAGPPPVVVGVGSLLPPSAGDVYSAARASLLAHGQRGVLVGAAPSLSAPGVCVVPRAPFSALFPLARAIIHHGGAGTLSEALRSGRPQVVVPFGNDQFDNAWRAERLGVARVVPRPRLSQARLDEALGWALGAPARAAAEAVAVRLGGERDGAEVVADDLERRFGAGRLVA